MQTEKYILDINLFVRHKKGNNLSIFSPTNTFKYPFFLDFPCGLLAISQADTIGFFLFTFSYKKLALFYVVTMIHFHILRSAAQSN